MSITIKKLDQTIPCQGISVRTTNQAELNPDTAKIGKLWQTFYQEHFAKLAEGSDVYGVYHNYESDTDGAFDVSASWTQDGGNNDEFDVSSIESVTIATGKYLVFSEQGAMPDAVITAWQTVWAYFNDADCKHSRLYDVDFEHYVSQSQVDLYIGIE